MIETVRVNGNSLSSNSAITPTVVQEMLQSFSESTGLDIAAVWVLRPDRENGVVAPVVSGIMAKLVAWGGLEGDQWAVFAGENTILTRDGRWVQHAVGAKASPAYKAATRWPFAEALAAARKAADEALEYNQKRLGLVSKVDRLEKAARR